MQVEPGVFCLQLDRIDLGYKAAAFVGQEGSHDAEHGVTETADVQHIAAIRGLGGRVRLEVDADQPRARKTLSVQPNLVADKRLPLCHNGNRAVPACAAPTLLVAHQHAACELPLGAPGVGRRQPSLRKKREKLCPPSAAALAVNKWQDKANRLLDSLIAK